MLKNGQTYFKNLVVLFLSYRNQSTDLLCKSMDWFLYDGENTVRFVK